MMWIQRTTALLVHSSMVDLLRREKVGPDLRILPPRLGHVFGSFEAELRCVFVRESLPTGEPHGVRADKSADRSAVKKTGENVEADVPARGAHRDEVFVDGG